MSVFYFMGSFGCSELSNFVLSSAKKAISFWEMERYNKAIDKSKLCARTKGG